MLILTRKQGQSIQISRQIRITVLKVKGHRVKLGVEAPKSVHICRGELTDKHELEIELLGSSDQRNCCVA